MPGLLWETLLVLNSSLIFLVVVSDHDPEVSDCKLKTAIKAQNVLGSQVPVIDDQHMAREL